MASVMMALMMVRVMSMVLLFMFLGLFVEGECFCFLYGELEGVEGLCGCGGFGFDDVVDEVLCLCD